MPRLAGECRGRGPHRRLSLVELGQFLPQMLMNWESGIEICARVHRGAFA